MDRGRQKVAARPLLVLLAVLALAIEPAAQGAEHAAAPLEYLPALKGDYFKHESAAVGRAFHISAPAPDATSEQGGAPAFHKFLKSELLPEVDRRYRTDPERRVLFGQSRGGSMVLYSAFTDPDLFWGRIVCNPGLYPGRSLFFGKPAAAARKDLGAQE